MEMENGNAFGELKVLERVNDLFYRVEIAVMREGENRNHWDYRNLERHADTFKGCPILTAYVGNKIGDGHNMDEKTGRDGEKYYSTMGPYAERIVGIIGESDGDIRVEERDGQKWMIARGRLWRFYHKELVDKIAMQGRMAVSAETEVFEGEKEGDIEVYTNWRGLGVTILGDDVQPAIPGANVKALSEIRQALNEMKLRAASLEEEAGDGEPEDEDDEGDEPEDREENEPEDRDDEPGDDEDDVDDGETERAVNEHSEKKQGVRKTMNKKQLAELAKRFGEGVRVLAADEKHVCMLRGGEPCAYVFENNWEETIVPEHFQALSATANFRLNEETAFDVDLFDVTNALIANCEASEKAMNAEKERADNAEAALKKMQEVERNRRIQDVKNALKTRLNEIMAEMEVDGCEEICDELCNKAEDYCGDCGNAEWNGAEMAADELNARCMKRVLEAAKKKNANDKKTLAWDLTPNGGNENDGLNGAIERIMK